MEVVAGDTLAELRWLVERVVMPLSDDDVLRSHLTVRDWFRSLG